MTGRARSGARTPLGPILIGLCGVAVLVGLGVWQVKRLEWKQTLIARMEARADAPPQALPVDPDPERDAFLPVRVVGVFDHDAERYFLTSRQPGGPGFHVIAPFETGEGRRILVDRGYVPQARRDPATRMADQPAGRVAVEGVLRWPRERGPFTPDPVESRREWYARDVPALAAALGTEPVLLQQAPTGALLGPQGGEPAVELPNNHLQYAVTWFSLAAVWAAMSLAWVLRERRLARDARRG